MGRTYACGDPSCTELVSGIYCEKHREDRARKAREVREAASQRMKDRWAADPEGMRAALAAGRAPAQEGE